MAKDEKIAVENINAPDQIVNVNAMKYRAMKKVFLQVLPDKPPGLTQKEIVNAVTPQLPDDAFPGGATAGWWAKTVQLDLEAKNIVIRETTKPLRWHKVSK